MKLAHALTLAAILAAVCCSCNKKLDCTAGGYEIRLTAPDENIIRVQAVPENGSFPDEQSLSVICKKQIGKVKIKRNKETCILETSALKASVSMSDGCVLVVRKSDGAVLVEESCRSFTPIEVDGDKGWTVHQEFKPFDESFFGLGQDQTDEWDWKGRNETLYQYNTKISIPFAVSSRKYGLLWDSNSLCRWGDPRPYSDLGEVFRLWDADGQEGAITGTYVSASGAKLVRRETSLSQEYLRYPQCDVVVGAPESFNFDGASVSFDGELEALKSGIHHFYLYYAGYTKVYIDGKQVMPEIWRTSWNPNGRKFELDIDKGEKLRLHIDWKPDGSVSYNALKVLSPRPEEKRESMSWWGEMQDQVDYYVINGENIDEVIGGYRLLTGKAPMMPKWAMGYWQSRERYSTQEDLVNTVKEFRRRGIPIDNIVQDWQYWKDDKWGSHEFDKQRYPDPKGMIDEVHSLGARFMISVWPKFYTDTEHFKEFDSNAWMYPNPVKDDIKDWLGHSQSFYDAYSAGARKLFWEQLETHLYSLGVDAWWMDADEPNIHDCINLDNWKKLCGPTALGSSTRYLNSYSLVNGMAFYEGQKSAAPESRVFILSRNGFSGIQRYSVACWSGDIGTRWEEMKAQISAGLNFSISGIPFWCQDIGGFSVEKRYMEAQGIYDNTGFENEDLKEWRELQARWHEWGIFTPLYRSHGQWPFREPWNIAPQGSETYEAIVAADKLRYSLMPYIYTLNSKVWFDDYTIMRPLAMDFTDDRKALATSDEFMFGDALLVCPVYEYGARSRKVYLPEGSDWYDFYTGKKLRGGQAIQADAPYGRIPLYGRSGQIVPCGPDVSSTADNKDGRLTLLVFPGKNAEFILYEDDGVSCAYESGECSRIPIQWDEAGSTLVIGKRMGEYPGMIKEREIRVKVTGREETAVRYYGSPVICYVQ